MNDLLDEQPIPVKRTLQFRLEVILTWVFLFFVGFLFQNMHWPFNSIVQIIGAGGFMAYSLSFLVLARPRTITIIVCSCISLLWILIIVWGTFFNGGYPFNLRGTGAQGLVFAFLFLVHFFSIYFIKKSRS